MLQDYSARKKQLWHVMVLSGLHVPNRTLLVTVGSCLATDMRCPNSVFVRRNLSRTLVARVNSCSTVELKKLLEDGRSLSRDTTICKRRITDACHMWYVVETYVTCDMWQRHMSHVICGRDTCHMWYVSKTHVWHVTCGTNTCDTCDMGHRHMCYMWHKHKSHVICIIDSCVTDTCVACDMCHMRHVS